MELSDLIAYARERYHIEEERKWNDFPGFSVLVHPRTGKWVALLMRQWDTDMGEEIQRCDLKCGRQVLSQFPRPYLQAPLRMRGPKWIGIAFGDHMDEELIYRLFDRAMTYVEPHHGFTVILDQPAWPFEETYHDTPLPFAGGAGLAPKDPIPERLREMKHLYVYGSNSMEARAENFYRQGMFMADYEDDAHWPGGFFCGFPTYHDMTTRQLRGYFAWRTNVRNGIFQPISSSPVYVYLYELINCIGVSSPEKALERLEAFESGYIDSGMGDAEMRRNIRRWMMEFAIVHDLPQAVAQKYADPAVLERDRALHVLRHPENFTDADVLDAMRFFDRKSLAQSPVMRQMPERGVHLFSEVWRRTVSGQGKDEADPFTLCFGKQEKSAWHPFANAVYHWQQQEDRTYVIDDCRVYSCRSGEWQMLSYESLYEDMKRFRGLIRQAELMFRRYLKTGNYLKEKPEDAWAIPAVRAVIEEDRRAQEEAARPKVVLDLSGLDRIRQDARITRDSLLTDEEKAEMEAEEEETQTDGSDSGEAVLPDLPLDAVQTEIVRALLEDRETQEILKKHHLMPTMTADAINEAMFEEIGDNILDCDGTQLSLVEDYREDLLALFGGKNS